MSHIKLQDTKDMTTACKSMAAKAATDTDISIGQTITAVKATPNTPGLLWHQKIEAEESTRTRNIEEGAARAKEKKQNRSHVWSTAPV